MRPPSYYTSLASSNSSSSNNRNSSQQLRSSFSSSSSTSYATRTHLPFVPQTMLVAHCYTGVGSSTKPYGQSTSSLYSSSSNRLGSSAGSYTSSYGSSRPSSTKRHHLPSLSSLSSSSSSSYSPRSSYLSSGLSSTSTTSSYRRPSYVYQPIKLRERPLLTRISNQIGQRYDTSADSRRPPSGLASSRLTTEPRGGWQSSAGGGGKSHTAEQKKQEERDWSSDVARNISRNKYLIKFREIDKPRASLVPDRDIVSPLDDKRLVIEEGARKEFETREGPDICVTVKLPTTEEQVTADMRVPPVDQLLPVDESAKGREDSQVVVSKKKDECDTQNEPTTTTTTSEFPGEAKKVKAPKEKRNIKLKIKNVNTAKAELGEVPVAVNAGQDNPTAGDIKINKKKTTTTTTTEDKAATPTKTKVKRLVKNKVAPSELPVDVGEPAVKSELKAKDSLLTKKLSDRKVLSPKQLNLIGSKETTRPPPVTAKEIGPSTDLEVSSPKSADSANNKRIRFKEYNYEDFNFLSVLGHGGWGFVILAELKNHEACFAVKCIKKITIVEDDDFDSIMIERKVLTLGNIHPFICKLFCTFETQGYLFFAMEYCAGGDLMFHVQREGKFTEARSRFYAAEIICAIKFLHNQHIIYRDLKLDNILLDSRGHIRLVDFGMCQCRTYREEMLPSNFCGTPEYISPEIIKGVPYNHSVDWWSFGVLLYEMAVGKMPFRGNDENELLWNVCYEQIHYPMFLTKELTSLLQSLLEREPTKRMGMSTCKAGDIYDQCWFKGVDWRAIEELRVPPPFVPDVTSERDVQNFDSDFTQSTPELSPVDESTLKKIDQSQFQKFPYTNPNISIFG